MKNITALLFYVFVFIGASAQQADSDKKDSLGHARPAISSAVSKQKPTSTLKKDAEQTKSSTIQQPKMVSTIKPTSDKKNHE